MMRGRLSWAVAVRCPDGDIYVEEHDLAPACDRPAWTRLPIVRGCASFVESMLLSYQALDIASAHAYEDEDSEAPANAARPRRRQGSRAVHSRSRSA